MWQINKPWTLNYFLSVLKPVVLYNIFVENVIKYIFYRILWWLLMNETTFVTLQMSLLSLLIKLMHLFWTKVLLYYKNLLTPNFCTVVYNMYIMSNKQDNVQSAVNYHKIALDKKIITPMCKGVVNFAIMNRHSLILQSSNKMAAFIYKKKIIICIYL